MKKKTRNIIIGVSIACVVIAAAILTTLLLCLKKDNNGNNVGNENYAGTVIGGNSNCLHDFQLAGIVAEKDTNITRNGLFECTYCDAYKHQTITYEDLGFPIINLDGPIGSASKTDLVTVSVSYSSEDNNFDCYATIKVQGASSSFFPKKNYTIKFYKDEQLSSKKKVTLVDEWGKESKYCMKANWVDYSQARNVVSAKLYGEVVRTRDLKDEFSSLVNGGAIDGYPIVVFANGNFLGLYTMNIPKDEWLFDMDDDGKQAILMGDELTDSVALRKKLNRDFLSSGWELEYCSTKDSSWVVSSFNEVINFINNNNG